MSSSERFSPAHSSCDRGSGDGPPEGPSGGPSPGARRRRGPLPGAKLAPLVLLCWPGVSPAAEGFLLGFGVQGDTESGRALSAFADVGFTEATWAGLSLATTSAEGFEEDLGTRYASLSLDHEFDPVGLRVSAGVWGDPDLVDSNDLGLSLYWKAERWRLAFDYERRDIEITVRIPDSDVFGRPIEFQRDSEADGYGIAWRYSPEGPWSVAGRAMHYEYGDEFDRLRDAARFAFFAPSVFTIANSLLDNTVTAYVEREIGATLLDVEVGRDRLVLERVDVVSASVGLLFPVATRADLQLRVGISDADELDSSGFAGLFFYYYGGN